MPRLEDSRFFAVLAALLLGVMGTAMLTSSLQENDSYDEAGHLAAGYGYLKLGDFGVNAEHPPLGNILSALPLLPLNPRLATEHPSWRQRAAPIAGAIFLYRNRERPDTLLLLGRIPTMALTLVLGCILAFWARKHFGPAVALFALFLYALDPNLIAHGRYITTDLIATLFIFAACISWARFLATQRWRDLLWAGLVLGLALASKFSTLFLLPVFALLYLIRWRQGGRLSLGRLAVAVLVLISVPAVVVGIAYWPETAKLLSGRLPLEAHSYLLGLQYLGDHFSAGHPAYLLGEVSGQGWWYYFPVAFAVKTPTAVLLLMLLAAVAGVWELVRRRRSPSTLPFAWIVLAVPPAVYFLLSMNSKLDLGLRHLLPIYPFLFVLLSAVLFRLRALLPRRAFVAVILLISALQITESARAHPHYLAFFNSLAGGSSSGPRYLVDSNLDWGQDVKKLKVYMDARGIEEVCLAYFGTADVPYHGIRHRRVPLTWEVEERKNLDCVVAISATLLQDVYVEPRAYEWLRRLEPAERVGYSIYVYDLRRHTR